jgi:GNAT superfamily N-acetyltransferase
MEILDSDIKDLKKIALCHRAAFPKSLSSKLGLNYCMKMLSFYLVDERGLLFHLNEGEEIVGYCGGLMNKVPGMHGSATSMTQYTFKALTLNVLIRPWLIFNHEIRANLPLIIRNIKLKLLGRDTGKTASTTPPNREFIPSMGLVVIGVSPEHQGKGYGSLLLREFESRARKEGFPRIHLSVRKNNNQAIRAYEKNGWVTDKEGKEELSMYKMLD